MRRFLSRLLCGLALACADAQADTWSLVTGDGYPPFADTRAEAGGASVALLRAALAEEGQTLTVETLPWARGYAASQERQYAGTFPYAPSAEREVLFLYSEPLHRLPQYLWGRGVDAAPSLDGLGQHTLCIPHAWLVPDILTRAGARLERAPDLGACMRMVLARRVDYMAAPSELLFAVMAREQVEPVQMRRSAEPIAQITLHLIAPRADPHSATLIKLVDHGLATLRARGEYARILARHGLTP